MGEHQVFTKCAWRLVPLILLVYVAGFVDRVNVGFAALTMNRDLGFSAEVYGFGAGIFSVGYVLFQVPSNLILQRVGSRRWIFCIMVTWGTLSTCNALIQGQSRFYVLRFLLGLAEAGLPPGMIFYLTLWFPPAYRARLTATLLAGGPLAFIVVGALSGIILNLDGALGLHGWQWLFLIEGAPALLLAFVVLKLLPDGPQSASWLSSSEKAAIAKYLRDDIRPTDQRSLHALLDLRLLALCVADVGILTALNGVALWLPQIVQSLGFSTQMTGVVAALPYAVAMVAMIFWGRSSDARNERFWHVALPVLIAASGLAITSVSENAVEISLPDTNKKSH